MKEQYAIGVDVGGSKIAIAIVNQDGKIFDEYRCQTLKESGAQVVQNQIVEGIQHLISQSKITACGIGIGIAGQVSKNTGHVSFAPNLGWRDISLGKNMQSIFHIPIMVVNDVRAITYGEWIYGAGRGSTDLLCLFIGTGIGAGIVSGGKLLTGHENNFGEVGHLTIDFHGPFCSCGKRGCLEVYSSGWGIAARANETSAKKVIEAFRKGDSTATQVMEQCKEALISGVASMVNVLNPERIVIGGGIIDGFPELISMIEEGVRAIALRTATISLQFVRSELGNQAGVIGSATTVLQEV